MGVVTALLIFILMAGVALNIQNRNLAETKTSSVSFDRSDAAKIAVSGIHIAKEALTADSVWGDCDEAETYCSDGYFPLYSRTLGEKLENAKLSNGKLTVLIEPQMGKYENVIIVGDVNNKKVVLGVKFQKLTSTDKVPLAYGSSSDVREGTVCSYYWNEEKNRVDGVTLPNFSIFLKDNFYWSPNIYVPSNPAGPNPKDVKFATNYSTEVRGYRVIDKLYSTGDIYLQNGAYLGLAYANKRVYTDSFSSYDKKVENGNFRFPSFASTLTDNDFIVGSQRTFYCLDGDKYINSGEYEKIVLGGNCRLHIVGNNVGTKYLVATGASKVLFDDPDTNLKAENIYIYYSARIEYQAQSGRDSFITVKAKNIYMGLSTGNWWGSTGYSGIVCSDPLTCLIDTNNLTTRQHDLVQGTVLVRNKAYMYASTLVGNIFAENFESRYSTLCNVVDKDGSQLVSRGYFDIVDPNGDKFPAVVEEIKRVICTDVNDCKTKLN